MVVLSLSLLVKCFFGGEQKFWSAKQTKTKGSFCSLAILFFFIESISSTCLRAVFMRADPHKHKMLLILTVFFAILWSVHVKAVHIMSVKLNRGSSSFLWQTIFQCGINQNFSLFLTQKLKYKTAELNFLHLILKIERKSITSTQGTSS